ncbi:MAG TPA: S8 family serine peptidase [Solirubrobacterales bacterium]|nr:S8 family serine peptidase [Solirubrobacterales bacterium]
MILPGELPRRRAIAALALALAVLPSTAFAAAGRRGGGDLSPRLAELAQPSVRSAPPAEQAKALSVAAEGPGSLLREGNRVLVEVRFDHGAAAGVDDLRTAGAKVVDVSARYQTVTVAARASELERLSGVPNVASATEVLTPITSASTCPSGIVLSEGDQQLRAAEARTSVEVDGNGVTVGILSDSFDRATEAADESGPVATHESEDVASGDLPGSGNTCTGQATPVNVLDDTDAKGEDEGRAMAQIVHDLAPGANLAFATAFTSETAFAENIKELAKPSLEGGAGASVIADDVSYFEEPFFQEGPVGVAVKEVTEGGVSYFSSAANNNLINGGRDIASWEAPEYRDSLDCPAAVIALSEALEGAGEPGLNPGHCMDFNPGPGVDRTFQITVSKGATLILDLQWAEPWEAVGADIDAFLLGPGGGVEAESTEDNVFGSKRPFELMAWENETGASANVQLVLNRYSGSTPRLKFALLQNGGGVASTEYESSQGGDVVGPTIFGHNGAEDATSVGAIRYNATEAPEPYSSRGPVTHYFGPVKGATAAESLEPPQVISKPDLTATDCGATTFFASFVGAWRFCGTSAAAPHAAAIAALMLQEEPAATPAQIRLALQESATPIGSSGPCAVGAGLVDAVGALEALLAPGSGSTPACAPPVSGPVVEGGGSEPPPIEADKPVSTPSPPAVALPPFTPNFDAPPSTFFRKHPPHVIRTRRQEATVVFRLGASESGATFACRVDGAPFHGCRTRFVGRFGIGAHVLRVVASDAAGNVDPTPAVFRFRVKQGG